MKGKKVLITGFSGFVGRHFINYLKENDIECDVLGIDVSEPQFDILNISDSINIKFEKVDLLNSSDINSVIDSFIPDYVLHLASISSVAYSWNHPAECFKNNTQIFLNLMESVMKYAPDCRVLSVGSSEEYGNVSENDLPLKENMEYRPVSPYAVARVSQEMMSKIFTESYGMNIMLTRSFNHIGPYQDTRFVVPSFIKRILDLKKEGRIEGTIETGDLEIVRDFVDVRDVVKAYYLILTQGEPGEIYNICSGKGHKLSDIVEEIASIVGITVKTIVNPEYVRPNDNKVIIGSNEKIRNRFGWQPEYKIKGSLESMIEKMDEIKR